jgi:CRP/FNR family cyclic AMP-dependent transcriptional regulator
LSTILQLDARVIDRLARTHAGFAQGLLEEGWQQLNDVVQSYASRSLATLSQRLAREILLLDDLQLHDTMVPVTEQQLADGVGSMRESVARAVAGLRREGWVATTRYGIILLDRGALRAHADTPA